MHRRSIYIETQNLPEHETSWREFWIRLKLSFEWQRESVLSAKKIYYRFSKLNYHDYWWQTRLTSLVVGYFPYFRFSDEILLIRRLSLFGLEINSISVLPSLSTIKIFQINRIHNLIQAKTFTVILTLWIPLLASMTLFPFSLHWLLTSFHCFFSSSKIAHRVL